MKSRLFVYGTLAPGCPNHHLLQPVPGKWEPATIRGTLTRGGRGSALGYPGVVLDQSDSEVPGYLFSSYRLHHAWKRLDEFEGNGYLRKTVTVTRRDGSRVKAQVYALRGSAAQFSR